MAAFLTHLATKRNIAASTQNQALCAIVFLYRHVLQMELGEFDGLIFAKRPKKRPEVFTRQEVQAVLSQLKGISWIMASLMYGTGLRLMECVRLRLADLDFGNHRLMVRDGKGAKDIVTMPPDKLIDPLKENCRRTKILYRKDLKAGCYNVYLPIALSRNYPHAHKA